MKERHVYIVSFSDFLRYSLVIVAVYLVQSPLFPAQGEGVSLAYHWEPGTSYVYRSSWVDAEDHPYWQIDHRYVCLSVTNDGKAVLSYVERGEIISAPAGIRSQEVRKLQEKMDQRSKFVEFLCVDRRGRIEWKKVWSPVPRAKIPVRVAIDVGGEESLIHPPLVLPDSAVKAGDVWTDGNLRFSVNDIKERETRLIVTIKVEDVESESLSKLQELLTFNFDCKSGRMLRMSDTGVDELPGMGEQTIVTRLRETTHVAENEMRALKEKLKDAISCETFIAETCLEPLRDKNVDLHARIAAYWQLTQSCGPRMKAKVIEEALRDDSRIADYAYSDLMKAFGKEDDWSFDLMVKLAGNKANWHAKDAGYNLRYESGLEIDERKMSAEDWRQWAAHVKKSFPNLLRSTSEELCRFLDSEDKTLRSFARAQLVRREWTKEFEEVVLPTVVTNLQSDGSEIRVDMVKLLEQLGSTNALPILSRCATEDTDEKVKEACKQAIRMLGD